MRVVFMGTPEFAVPSLKEVARAHQVAAVFTRPDRPTGRGRKIRPCPVKQAAEELSLPVYQPESLREPSAMRTLQELSPDVVCVAAYGLILPPELLDVPPHGCINVHASLLPRHRGAAPVHRAILEGDEMTGVSIMKMEEGLDTGPVALTTSIPIAEMSVDELTFRLAEVGADALIQVLSQIETGTVHWVPQDDGSATYAAKVTRADVSLHPELSVSDAIRRVRASTSSAPARACIDGRTVTVIRASRATDRLSAGAVLAGKDRLLLGFSDGSLCLDEIRPEGRSCMDGACFARGVHLGRQPVWESCG